MMAEAARPTEQSASSRKAIMNLWAESPHHEFVGFGQAGMAHVLPSAPSGSGQRPVPQAAVLRHLLNEADSGGRPWQHEWVRPAEAVALVALLESVGHPAHTLCSSTAKCKSAAACRSSQMPNAHT
jgi:hypothetical protein